MDELWPPSSPSQDEKVVLDRSAFRDCKEAVQAFASRHGGKMENETYTVSKEWGKVLRAKITSMFQGSPVASLVICWSGAGPKLRIVVMPYDDGL